MADLLVLAFQADLTRIATFVFANDGSNRSYRAIGVPDGHHDLSHHGGDAAKQQRIRKINQFHVAQLAYLLEKLKSIPEGSGTLLDHCLIVYGSGISDGNAHAHDDLPILLAGRGNGDHQARPAHPVPEGDASDQSLRLDARSSGSQGLDRFGDSTGRLPGLRG